MEVEFHLISDRNYSDAVELMLTSGEQVDILWGSNSLFVKAYVNRQLCDLEPLLKENGKDIIDAVGWKYINCCRIGGTLYGLPNNRDFAAGWDSYALRKDILNKYNIKASDIKNIKDLEKVFDLVQEKENGGVPLACTGALFGNFSLADGINSLVSGGHENYGQEDEVVDIFETEEYKNRLKQVRKWYLKGYMGDNILENNAKMHEMVNSMLEIKDASIQIEKIIETIYKSPALELFKADCLERQEEKISLATLDVRLWLSDEEDIVLIKDYYDILEGSGKPMESFRNSYEFWNNTICAMLVTSLCDLQIGKMSSGCNKTLCLRQWQCINIRKDHFLISFKCCIYRIQYFIICRRSKYFVYFRYFFQNLIFISLSHAPRHDQCFYFSFFFQFCHL